MKAERTGVATVSVGSTVQSITQSMPAKFATLVSLSIFVILLDVEVDSSTRPLKGDSKSGCWALKRDMAEYFDLPLRSIEFGGGVAKESHSEQVMTMINRRSRNLVRGQLAIGLRVEIGYRGG